MNSDLRDRFFTYFIKFQWEILLGIVFTIICLCFSNHLWLKISTLDKNLIVPEHAVRGYYLFFGNKETFGNKNGTGRILLNSLNIYDKKISVKSLNKNILKLEIDTSKFGKASELSNLKKVSENQYFTQNEKIGFNIVTNEVRVDFFSSYLYALYQPPFHFYTNTSLNYCLFVIIAFFSFVFFYSLFKYLFDLKRNHNEPVVDIIFVIIISVLLLLPTGFMNKDNVSVSENRKLAKFPELKIDGYFNNNWGKEFEKYFNDRFFGRDVLNVFYKNFVNMFSNVYQDSEFIVDKRKGIFTYKEAIKYLYMIRTENELQEAKDAFDRLSLFCGNNGAKLYIIVIPDRTNVYREDIPYHHLEDFKTVGEQLQNFLMKFDNLDYVYIYPKEDLLEAKKKNKKELYFKTDAHQSDFGGYISYIALMKVLKKDFKNLKAASLSEYDMKKNKMICFSEEEGCGIGNANKSSLNNVKYLNTEYEYYYPKKNIKLFSKPYGNSDLLLNKSYYPKGYNKKVLLIGSSYVEKLYIFLKQTFRYTDKVRVNNLREQNFHMSRFENKIREEKPDIMIVVLNESEAFQYIQTMYDDSKELDF